MDKKDYKKFHDEFKYLEKRIKDEKRIVIYRHVSPDFDALGSQYGLANWIKENYPDKEVYCVGENQPNFQPSIFPLCPVLPESFYEKYNKEHLAITVDVADTKRISDNHIDKADEVIKLDHHPLPIEQYQFGDYLIVHPERPAASEIIALFVLSRGKGTKVSKKTAEYLYCGIVGDTGRFLYEDADDATLRISADLLALGVDKTSIYDRMYETDLRKMNILKYCLNNFHLTEKGTCYYVLTQKVMDELQMTSDEGNLHINTFRNMKGVRCVCSITEDIKNNNFRVSLRSSHTKVSPAANKFDGGGHDYAAGCKIKNLDELDKLIQACDELE